MIGLTCDFRCCTPCYPAPSDLFTKLVSRVADDMEADLNSRHRNTGPVLKADSHPPSNTTAPLELEILAVVQRCREAFAQHLRAISFVSQYGTLFRKFDGDHRYSEVLSYLHTILFALVVGLLKRDTRGQALAAFGLWSSLLCYYVWASPFNEHLRNRLEVGAVACFVGALGLMVLRAFDVLDDVGDAVTYLCMGSMGFKIAYQTCVLARVWLRKRRPARKEGKSLDAVPLEANVAVAASLSMETASATQEWNVSEPSFPIYDTDDVHIDAIVDGMPSPTPRLEYPFSEDLIQDESNVGSSRSHVVRVQL